MLGPAGLDGSAVGPVSGSGCCAPCKKDKLQRGSAGLRPWLLRCLSQFLSDERKSTTQRANVLRMFAYLSPMGWPGIYSVCFFQLDDDKDSLLLDVGFSFLITVRLIRDNWKVIIGNYPTSLIGEIRFDLRDKQWLGIILFPLLM